LRFLCFFHSRTGRFWNFPEFFPQRRTVSSAASAILADSTESSGGKSIYITKKIVYNREEFLKLYK